MKVLGYIGVLVACFGFVHASSADEAKNDIQQILETFHTTYAFPGATVAYATSDGTVETFAVGYADVEAGTPMVPEHRMLAASIGKTVWGALVLALEADDKLSRTDLVSTFLGHWRWFARVPNADGMTVGQLLTHTSGLPDHVHTEGVATELIALGREDQFDPTALVSFVLDAPPLFEAGTAWAYSDTGYVLLGMVIEEATGQDVFDLAETRILSPLSLMDTSPSNAPQIDGVAIGYTVEDNPFGLPSRTMDEDGDLIWNPAVELTGGGFASTSEDLAQWGHALFTGKALDGNYLDGLLDFAPVHPDAPGVFYGAGVAIYQDTPFGPVYGHGGWIPGYVSSLRHYADHGVTIAFQINTDVGIIYDSTDLVSALEAALAEVLIEAVTP